MLSISESLRSKCLKSRSSHDQIWSKIQFVSHNSIQIQDRNVCQSKRLFRPSVQHCWKFKCPRSRSPHKRILAKLKDQKLWSQHDQIWCWILFWEKWLNLMCTIRRFLKASVWPRHTESTCRWRHPINASALNSVQFILVCLCHAVWQIVTLFWNNIRSSHHDTKPSSSSEYQVSVLSKGTASASVWLQCHWAR